MDMKENQQGIVYEIFDKKIASGAIATSKVRAGSVNEELAQELRKPVMV